MRKLTVGVEGRRRRRGGHLAIPAGHHLGRPLRIGEISIVWKVGSESFRVRVIWRRKPKTKV